MLKYKLLVAAASAVAFVAPATAQQAEVEAAVQAAPQPNPGAGAQVEAEVQAGAETDAGAAADGQAAAQAEAEPGSQADAAAQGDAGPITAATAADVRAGIAVLDPQGGAVGTVESVDAEGAVVSTGNIRAKMPISSFGKNGRGLVISMTRAELEAAAAARNPS